MSELLLQTRQQTQKRVEEIKQHEIDFINKQALRKEAEQQRKDMELNKIKELIELKKQRMDEDYKIFKSDLLESVQIGALGGQYKISFFKSQSNLFCADHIFSEKK